MSFSKLIMLTLAIILGVATAAIPPFETLSTLRGKLSDDDFVIDFADASIISTANFTIATASATDFPLLGFSDVDVMIGRVVLMAGTSFFTHFHPRSAEVFFVTRGTFRISLQLEGVGPSFVTNTVSLGQVTLFPQGLIHMITCIEADNACEYVSVFTSADPGLVAV